MALPHAAAGVGGSLLGLNSDGAPSRKSRRQRCPAVFKYSCTAHMPSPCYSSAMRGIRYFACRDLREATRGRTSVPARLPAQPGCGCSGVIGVTGPLGVIGLCDMGVFDRLMRSVTSTSSPTRSTAPDGPAQAYWPKTGLSTYRQLANSFARTVLRITRELVIHPSILRQQPIQLLVGGYHASLCKIHVQAQASDGSRQTSHRDFLLAI